MAKNNNPKKTCRGVEGGKLPRKPPSIGQSFVHGRNLFLPRDLLVLFQNAVFDVFTEFASHWRRNVPRFFALEERIAGPSNEKSVDAIGDAKSANRQLVIEDYRRHRLDLSKAHSFLERVDIHPSHRKALVISFLFFTHFFTSCFAGVTALHFYIYRIYISQKSIG